MATTNRYLFNYKQPVAPPATTTTGSNVPTPTGGAGPYGTVPGTTTTVDPAALWKTFYPNLSADTSAASGVIRSQLAGELTPEVSRAVTDAANARNVAGGVGGSPFGGSVIARDLGLTTLNLQNQGVGNLGNLLGSYYSNLVGPTTQLSQDNANLRAAPDPRAAAEEQYRLYEQQQQKSFERQQALMAQQFAQQASYLEKYLSQSSNAGGAGGTPKPYGVTYTYPGAATPYYSNITYR